MKKSTYTKEFTLVIIILFIGMSFLPFISNGYAGEKFTNNVETITFVQQFSKPELRNNNEFVEIIIEQTNLVLIDEQKPMMPIFSKTFELPFGTKITDLKVKIPKFQSLEIEKLITPVPKKQKIGTEEIKIKKSIDENIYSSNEPYPNSWYSYSLGTGLNKLNDHVLFLSVNIYPVQYIPNKNTIQYIDQIELTFTYEKSDINLINSDEYDLIIITPNEFIQNLEKLFTHKNNNGINTKLVSLAEIYDGYVGRDHPEKIKYFIKYAIEEWGIQYVLLVGDVQKLPIRNTYASWWEPDILSDLYYSDIYDSEFQFCSWDENGNNRFGEVNDDGYDLDGVDLFADAHIGRIACTNEEELETVIDKIIIYENTAYGSSWFKETILAGGDTFPPFYDADRDVFEGEITNEYVAQALPEFQHNLLWSSKHKLNALTFNRAINKGAGFLSYAGHGFEHGWGTYRPNAMVDRMIFYYMPYIKFLRNNEKLPIVFFDACLTAKLDFNISDLDEYYPLFIQFLVRFTNVEYDTSLFYHCIAWDIIAKNGGGAIASIGSTRTAYTWVNEHGVFAGAGYLDVSFFDSYEEGITVGEMLTQAQNRYIVNVGFDYFTIEEYILLGDPSLKVGGYQH